MRAEQIRFSLLRFLSSFGVKSDVHAIRLPAHSLGVAYLIASALVAVGTWVFLHTLRLLRKNGQLVRGISLV